MRNLIIVLNGPSAGGKTLVMEELLGRPELNLDKLVTVTTRPPRSLPKPETNGVDYYFLTPEAFEARKAGASEGDAIVEETEYPKGSGVKYGIFASEIQRIADLGKDAIAVLDMHGVEEMRRFYGKENVVSVFVYREIYSIMEALQERNLSGDEVSRRIASATQEMKNVDKADYVLYNMGTKEDLIAHATALLERIRHEKGAQ